MSGHGHVVANADGSKVRCGGPGSCQACTAELNEQYRMPAIRPGRRKPPPPDAATILQSLHECEVDYSLYAAFDEGFYGYFLFIPGPRDAGNYTPASDGRAIAYGHAPTFVQIAEWLHDEAIRRMPDSAYARRFGGALPRGASPTR